MSTRPPTTAAQIDDWRGAPTEHQRLEFKEAKASFDRVKLQHYCVALANEGGGQILLGIADKPPRPVVGTQAFLNPTKAAEELYEALGFRIDVEPVDHPDGRVLVFHVPSRPCGTAYHHAGTYLMRSGEALVPMSEDQLRRIFAEGKHEWLLQPAMTGADSQRVVELLDTQRFFDLLGLPYPTTREAVLHGLESNKLIESTRDNFTILRLGALLLAKNLSTFPDVQRKATRIVAYSGTSKLSTSRDITSQSGYAVGFQDLVQFVDSQLPQNQVIEDALRKEVKLVPQVVLRELLANALIHQDFTIGGTSVMVEIYSDRVEISNPGEPVVPAERFIDGYQSRNEQLADLMRRFRICEEKGSGVDRVVHAAEVLQLPAPDFRAGANRTTACVYGPRPFEEMDRGERIRATYQHCALRWVMNERMTNTTLRERFGLPESKSPTASQVINATMQARMIRLDERSGASKKLARYIPFWA
ncbi:MAG: putative DNA binding domain-containing protein [Planctomycetes bacterium]|jgi:ATP-dependent DNA helicase RecG|nr:putative DNA binding domain-containing protein [Planctomycetota bacterium]MCC7061742.1 putative DNA binding domain-containing protein [Planctomycetota bacterium]